MLLPEAWLKDRCRPSQIGQGRQLAVRAHTDELRLGVVMPTRNAAQTLGKHLLALRYGWPGGECPWNEIGVVDLGSSDATLEIARAQEARVLGGDWQFLSHESPPEGLALQRGIEQLGCDVLLVVPAQLRKIDWDLAAGLVLSLLDAPGAALAMGYERTPSPASRFALRPLLSVLQPDLAYLVDPCCPILAVRVSAVRELPIALTVGYEAALALEVYAHLGLEGLCQAPVGDLLWYEGERNHEEMAAFRSVLALTESAQRNGMVARDGNFGQLFTHMTGTDSGVLHVKSSLEHFRWHEPVSSAQEPDHS